MANVLALDHLYTKVRDWFATVDPEVEIVFGWREPSKQQDALKRIVFVPGDPSGNVGKSTSAKFPGRVPRPIATLLERFHIQISTSDPVLPEVELAQYRVARALRDAVHYAMHRAAHGTYSIDEERWDIDKQNERRFGAAIVMTCTLQAMVADPSEVEVMPTAPGARVETKVLDATDTQNISAADEP